MLARQSSAEARQSCLRKTIGRHHTPGESVI